MTRTLRSAVGGLAVIAALSAGAACALRADRHLPAIQVPSFGEDARRAPQRLRRRDIVLERGDETQQTMKGHITMMRRQFLQGLAPVAMTFSLLATAPLQAIQQLEAQFQERPVVRRRAPEGHRRNALAFVRTELFFGTAKPVGAVTEEEFNTFLDSVVTPLFPDGLTVTKAQGQFRGADGVTIKEDSYVLVLLYPVEGQKAGTRNIELIRAEYMRQHRQESVLRVDDPLLVWVSF